MAGPPAWTRRRPRILLANESGAGRGHVVSLRDLARAFGPGADYLAVLGRMEHAGELRAIGLGVAAGPRLRFRTERVRGASAADWGQFLGEVGFADEVLLTRYLRWWQDLLLSRAIDLVVADHAPVVLLAVQGLQARGLPIRALASGNPVTLPDWRLPAFPPLLAGAPRPHDEGTLLATVNRAGATAGVPPLRALPAIYRADMAVVRSLPWLDPGEAGREAPPVSPLSSTLPFRGEGDEVFVYCSGAELSRPARMQALCDLALPRRGFFPTASPEQKARLAAAGVVVEDAPLPPAEIARRSRIMLTSGQHGIGLMALALGLPQLILPTHGEQRINGLAAQRLGVARVLPASAWGDPGQIMAACLALHADAAMAERALALARAMRPLMPADPAAALRARVRPLAQALGLII